MKKINILNWQVILGIFLIALSVIIYYVHFLIFRDAHHIFIYLIGDIAFVFLEVLLVTLVIHNLLAYREKQALFKKMNMVIGAFFSQVGTGLIKFCICFDAKECTFAKKLIVGSDWNDAQFKNLKKEIFDFSFEVKYNNQEIVALKDYLVKKREFLLGLLENQNLLEHESFTDLLWSIFHLTEELEARKDLNNLTLADNEHLVGDIKRVYRQIVIQWLSYMEHLKGSYPYLFSLAMRTNPFDRQAKIELS